MNNSSRNAVIGLIKGYSFAQISSFVESLNQTEYEGELVLLAINLPSETVQSLVSRGVKIVPVSYRKSAGSKNSWARFWPQIKRFRRILPRPLMRGLQKSILHLMDVRHFHVKDFLRGEGSHYENVFVTDVRDVIFQGDPFAQPLSVEIEFFQETNRLKIKDCPFNSHWILERFGSEMLDKCGDSVIHCFGTIRARRSGMLDFLERYEDACLNVIKFDSGSGDQGIFNTMIGTSNIPRNFASIPNFTGSVATLGWMREDEISTDKKGRVIEPETERVIPVIHQHDRFPRLAEQLELLFTKKGA